MLYPIKLTAPLKDYIWGGTKLKTEFGKQSELPKIAESWELACHKDGMSVIENGEYAGMTLQEYIDKEPGVVGTKQLGNEFPLLIKLIDAQDNLSIQVHPDDDYAKRYEATHGKTEMWYVLSAESDATLIYGLERGLTRDEFASCIENGDLLSVCNQVPVKKGDVFFIEAGTLHGIGKGIVLVEVQQNSNITYRVYDYGRVGKDGRPRQLHKERAIGVAKLTKQNSQLNVSSTAHSDGSVWSKLIECDLFTVRHIAIKGKCEMEAVAESFQSIIVIEGELTLLHTSGKLKLCKGESVFIPAGMGRYVLSGQSEIILSCL